MSDLLEHLNILSGSQDEPADRDLQFVEEWRRRRDPDIQGQTVHEDIGEDEGWCSVLDVYSKPSTSKVQLLSPLVKKLLIQPHLEQLMPAMVATLASNRPDDAISGELAEMLGFESIELVVEILANRISAVHEISAHLQSMKANGLIHTTGGQNGHVPENKSLDPDAARRRMEETFRANAARPLFTGTMQEAQEALPHVYTSSSIVQNNSILSQYGTKYMLPLGTVRSDYDDYEEVILPPAKVVPSRATERLIPVSELDVLARGSFPGYASLNRIQSIVYPTAYQSNENVLVCAPTGAGKTDVAMLTILRVLDQHRSAIGPSQPIAAGIKRDEFKIVYVAPMKALASEITRKIGKRLRWLNILVRELTGDMQLTKAEISETQIIVTTPEKWDVVTRKPTGEGELASKVRLLIIDEVHLLNDERGAVIETIVARTLRQVESSQSVIRIVGLSATLPNFLDVADFLCVSRQTGLFYFDSSFRPVPLEQHFLGIRGKANSAQSRRNLDKVTFGKVSELVREGHQVMVFVHARKETVKTALALKEAAMTDGILDQFSCEEHPQYEQFRRDISQSRNKEMKQLFDNGFGIHHAGMLRLDRNMMERMFEARAIKVLCCTATLAWGVNLPAHAVIIKGTQVYDSGKGSFVDLSVLDVLQVFGRAGRPGMESSGVGFICTNIDKLDHYLDAVTSQTPIESKFTVGMIDAMNAEIALGTVASIHDAVQWVGYTYLFVRMRKNPFQYGLTREQVMDDPQLLTKRTQLVVEAASRLAEARMITFDRPTGEVTVTDLGRIAAKYYITHASIQIFNNEFRQKMTEADVLAVLCMSTEFNQIQVRENEVEELKFFMENAPCRVKGGTDTGSGKVNILLQSYISQYRPEDFALVSDQAYAAQNAGRIVRALLEIAISRKWANVSAVLMGISKAIEKRLWTFDNPLKQLHLKQEVLYNIERWADDYSVANLAAMSAADLGELVHLNETHGSAILKAAKQFPSVEIAYSLRPLGWDVLKIAVRVMRRFNWDSKIHGSVEPFWLWVEDSEGVSILQLSHLIFRQTTEVLDLDFVISIPGGRPPPFVTIRFVSDRWVGAEDEIMVPLTNLVMPSSSESHTPRLDLPFLSLSVLQDGALESVLGQRINSFNALQTQSLWSIVKTRCHSLLCAPTACGKSVLGQIAVWETLRRCPVDAWAMVVVPRRSIGSESLSDLRAMFTVVGYNVEYSKPESVFRTSGARVRVVTAADLLVALSTRRDRKASLSTLELVVCENLELLDASYELGLSLLLQNTQALPMRLVGLSSSLNDAADLAAWLNVDPIALHSFRPSDRDQALSVHTHSFTIPYSAALYKAMAKPAHTAIQQAPGEPAIVFVASRSQCRSVALDLVTQCALELGTPNGYLPERVSPEEIEYRTQRLQDRSLVDFISKGVGFFHEGVPRVDRLAILELYAEGIIRVLLVPRDACWTLPVRAATVIVMGTQYVHVAPSGEERQVREYSLAELMRMQGRAVRHDGAGHCHLFCQAEAKDTITRFLADGLPLESQLLETDELVRWYVDRRREGTIKNCQEGVDMLSSTFIARRLLSNPVYYDSNSASLDELLSRIVDQLENEVMDNASNQA